MGVDRLQKSITCKSDLKTFVNFTINKYGKIDAVINNTDYTPKGKFWILYR